MRFLLLKQEEKNSEDLSLEFAKFVTNTVRNALPTKNWALRVDCEPWGAPFEVKIAPQVSVTVHPYVSIFYNPKIGEWGAFSYYFSVIAFAGKVDIGEALTEQPELSGIVDIEVAYFYLTSYPLSPDKPIPKELDSIVSVRKKPSGVQFDSLGYTAKRIEEIVKKKLLKQAIPLLEWGVGQLSNVRTNLQRYFNEHAPNLFLPIKPSLRIGELRYAVNEQGCTLMMELCIAFWEKMLGAKEGEPLKVCFAAEFSLSKDKQLRISLTLPDKRKLEYASIRWGERVGGFYSSEHISEQMVLLLLNKTKEFLKLFIPPKDEYKEFTFEGDISEMSSMNYIIGHVIRKLAYRYVGSLIEEFCENVKVLDVALNAINRGQPYGMIESYLTNVWVTFSLSVNTGNAEVIVSGVPILGPVRTWIAERGGEIRLESISLYIITPPMGSITTLGKYKEAAVIINEDLPFLYNRLSQIPVAEVVGKHWVGWETFYRIDSLEREFQSLFEEFVQRIKTDTQQLQAFYWVLNAAIAYALATEGALHSLPEGD